MATSMQNFIVSATATSDSTRPPRAAPMPARGSGESRRRDKGLLTEERECLGQEHLPGRPLALARAWARRGGRLVNNNDVL